MPVRIRITLIFSLLAFIILGLVCGGVYYFSYQARIASINTRLTNRAITTARLLSQREIFDRRLVQRIDSSTTISLKNKTVQAYDETNARIYAYSDLPGDTLHITPEMLADAREKGSDLTLVGDKEAVAYHYADNHDDIVIVTAAEDIEGLQNLRSLGRILLASFLVGNVFILVAGYFFSRGLLLPIKRISQDVADISAQNLTRRIQTGTTRDEWFQLSSTLNDLLNRLQESFELQRRFIANASHELSTPLTSISSQLEVALQRARDAEGYRGVMLSIYQDVQHMSKLTQTLLELAKASGDTGGLEISLLRIDEIILQLPAEAAKANASYGVRIYFGDLPDNEERLLVFGNEALLMTAIRNIVVNACKYAPDHLAHVRLEVRETALSVRVENWGAAIPKEELGLIFQPFYRVEESRAASGFGLGLPLADRIIKIHKGSISVRSDEGAGTCFIITLPAAERSAG